METTSLFNFETNTWEPVPVDQVKAALASGKYGSGGPVLSQAAGGVVTRPQSDVATARAQGETPAIVEAANRAAEARRDERAASLSDPVLSFAEAILDTATLGLIHIPGEKADIRRGEDKNSVLLGTLVGTVGGLALPGPVRSVAKGGEKFGRALAQSVLGEERLARGAGKAAARALEEAGTNAALMGATAFGHNLTDVVIEDKPFAGEAIAAEAGLGALLGGSFGLLSGGFAAARGRATKAGIAGQGGLVAGEVGAGALDDLASLRRGMDAAVEQHAGRIGVIDALVKDGQVPESFLKGRRDLLNQARKAADNLAKHDPARAMAGDAKGFRAYQEALERYHEATSALDGAMRPSSFEHAQLAARNPLNPADVRRGPVFGERPPDFSLHGPGEVSPDRFRVDAAMTPERRAAYKAIYGEEYMDGDFFLNQADDVAEAGGRVTPTSEANTSAGGARAKRAANRTSAGRAPGEVGDELAARDAVLSEADRPGPFTEIGTPPGQGPYRAPALPGARFGADDLRNVAGVERPLNQRAGEAPYLLGGDVHPVNQVLMQDGRIMPARSIEQNAADFLAFREKVLSDTFAPPAPATAPAQSGAATKPGTYRPSTAVSDAMETRPGGPLREPEALSPSDKAGLPGAKTKELAEPTTEVAPERPRGPVEYSSEGKQALRRWADQWAESGRGSRVSPGDEVTARFNDALARLREASGGRLDSAAALEIGERLGLKPARTPLGDALQQMYAIKRAAGMLADEARGVVTPLAKSERSYLRDWVIKRLGGKAGAAAGGALLGGALGGPVGFAAGAALAMRYSTFGARAASSAGNLYQRVLATGDTLLRGHRATVLSRAAAGNRPYQYSDAGPIQDPVKRIQDLQRVAANPELARSVVRQAMGDVVAASPELAQHIEETAVRQLQALAVKAPAIYFDALGRPLTPAAGRLRKFFEYENATHNLDGLLHAVASGAASDAQLDALKVQFPVVHGKLVSQLLADPERLKRLPAPRLRSVERVLGVPLTRGASDPGYVQRMQEAWIPPNAQAGPAPQKGGKAQSFKIQGTQPTPAQANATGRAPGNQ